jgi:hypothetical protein
MRSCLLVMTLLSACSASNTSSGPNEICRPPACTIEGSTIYVAEVSPPSIASDGNESTALAQEWSSVDIDPHSGEFVLRLVSSVILSGTVSVGGVAVDATVVASRPSSIPGRPDVVYQADTDPATGQYRLPVTPTRGGELYTLRVVAAPPSGAPPRQLEIAIQRDRQLDIDLDDSLAALQIRGAVRTPLQLGVLGMMVEVIDASGTLRSTVATTNQAGEYAVLVDHNVDLSTAQVTAIPGADSPVGTPSLASAIMVTDQASKGAPYMVDLPLPALPVPIRVVYRVSGVGSSGAESPIVGARCQFRVDVSDPASRVSAIYLAAVVSQVDGAAELDLLPGEADNRIYQVQITPPPASEFEALSTTSSVGSASGYAAPFVLSPRPQISGRTLAYSGQPVADVTVEPTISTLEAASGIATFTSLLKTSATKTDNDGRFALRVDQGTYEMSFLPPSITHLSRRWLSAFTVDYDTELGDLQLSSGVAAHAHLIGPTGLPLRGASVRLYALPPANLLCPNRDHACLSPAQLQAESTSDENGEAALLLAGSSPL